MNSKNFLKTKKSRYWLISLSLVLIAAFVFLRFNSARASNEPVKIAGTVTSVNVAETMDASGTLEAQPFAELTWGTNGVVDQVYVKPGDKVKAGDVLMKLKTNSVSSKIISAQGDLATAQKNLDELLSSSSTDFAQAVIDLRDAQKAYDRAVNYLEFLERSKDTQQTQAKTFIETTRRRHWYYHFKTKTFKGPAPEDWFTEAENDLALKKAQWEDAQRTYNSLKDGANAQDVTAAQTKVDAAQATVDSMSVIAPFDGEVLYVASHPNDVVTADSTALNMANLGHLFIETQVSESDVAHIKVGDPVTAALNAVSDKKLTGKVAAIDPLGQEVSGSVQYTVLIDIDKVAKDEFLPLESTANVTIQVKPAAPSLAVPITAIQNDSKGEYVLAIQPDGSTKRVDVISGAIAGDLVVVTGDLKEGDQLTMTQNNSTVRFRGIFGRGN